MDSVTAKLKSLEDDIRRLWLEFDKLKAGETILGCATKKEFCERKLNRTPQAVRYMLNPDLRESKQCLRPESAPAKSATANKSELVAVPQHQSEEPQFDRHPTPPAPTAPTNQAGKSRPVPETPSTPDPVAQLFMRADRLLPQFDSFFCEGADSPERSFPQLVEDAIQQVPTAGASFTIAYRTYANVKKHEALVDGKITHSFQIDELAQVLDAAADYFTDAAARVRKAAAGETVPAATPRPRKWK